MANMVLIFYNAILIKILLHSYLFNIPMKIKILVLVVCLMSLQININCFSPQQGVGYRVGNVSGYKLIKSYNNSKLYEIQSSQLDDQRPLKLVQLIGTHYQVGYAYAALLGPQIVQTYNTFLGAEFKQKWQIFLLQNFLSWQYDQYVSKQISHQFKQEIRGLQAGGIHEHSIYNLRSIVEQTLVITSYPGDFGADIIYTLLDQFLRNYMPIQNEQLLNIIQSKIFEAVKFLKDVLNRKRIHCSFFALWGSRTEGGKLITMRNLDWEANTGVNKYKTLFVWKVTGTIPHVTLGFPVLMGAITGMSKAGLTVHEAGLDSMRATELGFQWSLRLRYIMMYASNLQQAKILWQKTNNTLGMNHMIASASDLVTNHPAVAMETMRNYTAWFYDNDQRQRQTIFVDPQTKQKFRAGFAMKEAIFRTNHAYDPKINKYRTALPTKATSTMKRYMTLKDGIVHYETIGKRISNLEAINITAATAHKGGNNPLKCPGDGDQGTNVISAVFLPAELTMYVAFEYGNGAKYRTACCGVYVYIDMQKWFQ